MKILFMGTPDFASAALLALTNEEGFEVAAVVTKPDTRSGRGMKVSMCDVKVKALEKNIPVYQPETLKDGAFLPVLDEIKPDVIVVAAYGKILPEYVLNYPKYGCINIHGSLLPEYRGAAPIQRAVLDGKTESGVTIMYMEKGLDTGDMLLTEKVEIGENMTTGELFDELAVLGGRMIVKVLHMAEEGTLSPVKQDDSKSTYAEKISNEECLVDFNTPAKDVHNKIRGLSPFPGAFCFLDGKIIKLYNSLYMSEDKDGNIGEVVAANPKTGVDVKCADGVVRITKFKPEGKGVMTAADMINGRKIAVVSKFTTEK